jgi:hypothetical protein
LFLGQKFANEVGGFEGAVASIVPKANNIPYGSG